MNGTKALLVHMKSELASLQRNLHGMVQMMKEEIRRNEDRIKQDIMRSSSNIMRNNKDRMSNCSPRRHPEVLLAESPAGRSGEKLMAKKLHANMFDASRRQANFEPWGEAKDQAPELPAL